MPNRLEAVGTRSPPRVEAYAISVTEPTARTWEQLFAVPLHAFVKERNAIAARLKKEGRTAEARVVLRLRKPGATLWVTNRLARAEAKRLADFLESVESVRNAQLRDPRAAATAVRQQRARLEDLVRRAGDLLDALGHRSTPETRRRMSNTLLGAAVDRKLVEELRQGRLTAEASAPGFEVLTGAPPGKHLRVVRGARAAPPRVARTSDEDRSAEIEERAHRRREADELARAAIAHQQTAERHVREVEELGRDLAAARERLRAARRAAKIAAVAARRARHARP